MISNEAIPPKEDTPSQPPPTTTTTATSTTTEPTTIETPSIEAGEVENLTSPPETVTTTQSSTMQTNGRLFNIHFQEKAKLIREYFNENKINLNQNNTQLIIIVIMSFIAVGCSLFALASNNWICDANKSQYYGLWTMCNARLEEFTMPIIENANTTSTNSSVPAIQNVTGTFCVSQTLNNTIVYNAADKVRIDQLSASQGLIICGIIMYVLSIITVIMGYRFIRVNNLNSVRNSLVCSMFAQIISFFMQLIGFFLFILTERLSTSVGLLFVYFGIAMFATNIINFITIEYKSYKIRHVSI